VVVGDVVEKLLRVERTAQQKRQIAICRLYDKRQQIYSFCACKGIIISEVVFKSFTYGNSLPENSGDARKKSRIDKRAATGSWSSSRGRLAC
jgi:hypothetical protein